MVPGTVGGPEKRIRGRRFSGDLGQLKALLKRQLAEIEAKEKVANEALKPSTLEEAEQIEEKLKEALEEIQNMKAQFGTDTEE